MIARWRDADSYERLRAIDSYQGAKAQFAQKFVGPPDLSVNEVLVEM